MGGDTLGKWGRQGSGGRLGRCCDRAAGASSGSLTELGRKPVEDPVLAVTVSTQYLMNAGPRKLGGRHVHAVLSVTYVRPVDRLAIANLTALRFAWDGWGKTCQPGTHRGRF